MDLGSFLDFFFFFPLSFVLLLDLGLLNWFGLVMVS